MFMCQFLCVKFVAILGEGKKDEVCYSVQNKSKHTHMHARTCMCARPGKDRLQYSAAESHKSFNERIFQAQFITLRWLNMSGWQIVLELDEHQTCHSSDKIVSQPGLGAVTVRITCSWEKFLLTEIKYNCQNHLFLREVFLDGYQMQAEYIFSSPFKTHRRRVLLYKSSTKLLFVLDDEYYYEWVSVTAIKNVILMRSCWVIFVCVHVFRGFVCVKLCL